MPRVAAAACPSISVLLSGEKGAVVGPVLAVYIYIYRYVVARREGEYAAEFRLERVGSLAQYVEHHAYAQTERVFVGTPQRIGYLAEKRVADLRGGGRQVAVHDEIAAPGGVVFLAAACAQQQGCDRYG